MKHKSDSGFTLIEVILAMFLLLIGATTILGMLSFGAGTARTAGLLDESSAALTTVMLELEETLFPLVVDPNGIEIAGEPIPSVEGLAVPGFPRLSYGYRARPLSGEARSPRSGAVDEGSLEYLLDLSISWMEGGNQRSQHFTTILLREVPFGERLRRRFIEGREPLTWEEHRAAIESARTQSEASDQPRQQTR